MRTDERVARYGYEAERDPNAALVRNRNRRRRRGGEPGGRAARRASQRASQRASAAEAAASGPYGARRPRLRRDVYAARGSGSRAATEDEGGGGEAGSGGGGGGGSDDDDEGASGGSESSGEGESSEEGSDGGGSAIEEGDEEGGEHRAAAAALGTTVDWWATGAAFLKDPNCLANLRYFNKVGPLPALDSRGRLFTPALLALQPRHLPLALLVFFAPDLSKSAFPSTLFLNCVSCARALCLLRPHPPD